MRTRTLQVLALLGMAIAVAAVMGAGRRAVLNPGNQDFLFSATQIVVLPGGSAFSDGSVARLDTRTGAMYRFRGSVSQTGTRSTWEMRVPPVKEQTSGLLEVQMVNPIRTANMHDPTPLDPAVFLVDIVTGDTWILRERSSSNFYWVHVPIFGPSASSAQYD